MGTVAIVFHSMSHVQDEGRRETSTTYEISESDILLSAGGPIRGWRRAKYFYRLRHGPLQPIETVGSSTIQDTPENRSDRAVDIYLRNVGTTISGECRFEHETFIVGTKAFILSGRWRSEYELSERMKELACVLSMSGQMNGGERRLGRSRARREGLPVTVWQPDRVRASVSHPVGCRVRRGVAPRP
jgi:hypothetical protein